MKQIQRAKRHRGSAGGRQEPLAVDPRDPDIMHAHRITRRSSRPDASRVWSGSHNPPRRPGAVAGHGQLPAPADPVGNGTR
jgi:hypothetical protein